ncbi:protein-glutamate O-methyltransferase CheR [Lentibacillus sp. N15]|uniref:CheR family methyltransferase n=1 Tax=Lentibacillus songyuanensis TaxID=3136161 RepID=UPI0031BA6488
MDEGYSKFVSQMKQKLGVDLKLYKETQMKRRLTSLRDKRGYTDFYQYFQALDKNKQLFQELMDRITINVSEFYRNPKRWEVLKNEVLPELTKVKRKLTVWSAACSTGEEPYSMALLGAEYFPNIKLHIRASDIDETVLAKAKQGSYTEQSLRDLPRHLQNKYFTKQNGLFQIDPQLKQQVTFQKHNLLSDRFPQQVDLIICRNVLIYFTDQAKEIIYQSFSNALADNGVLFVGSTEQIFSPQKYGLTLQNTFFYKKEPGLYS